MADTIATVRAVADVTGGHAFCNELADLLQRPADSNSCYVLSYYPEKGIKPAGENLR